MITVARRPVTAAPQRRRTPGQQGETTIISAPQCRSSVLGIVLTLMRACLKHSAAELRCPRKLASYGDSAPYRPVLAACRPPCSRSMRTRMWTLWRPAGHVAGGAHHARASHRCAFDTLRPGPGPAPPSARPIRSPAKPAPAARHGHTCIPSAAACSRAARAQWLAVWSPGAQRQARLDSLRNTCCQCAPIGAARRLVHWAALGPGLSHSGCMKARWTLALVWSHHAPPHPGARDECWMLTSDLAWAFTRYEGTGTNMVLIWSHPASPRPESRGHSLDARDECLTLTARTGLTQPGRPQVSIWH
jgi:hypothetical protein